MLRNLFAILIMFLLFSSRANSQTPELIKLADLKQLLNPANDTTYVINFWATWCKPCIKELPYFDQLGAQYKNKKMKVVLVSLDFKRHFDSQLIPFLKKAKVTSQVVVLDEPDANLWIDLVDPSWSGAIPATIIINARTKHRSFHEREFTFTELENIVKPIITE